MLGVLDKAVKMGGLLMFAVQAFFLSAANSGADQWHVSIDGKAENDGTKSHPWDLMSALGAAQPVAAGDVVWIHGGIYRHPNRANDQKGYEVRLAGSDSRPIQIRGVAGERVTIDGGLTIVQPSTHLWVRDMEIVVSENSSMERRLNEPGSHPKSYGRPWGGLNVYSGNGCKFIHLVIHDNAQGVSWWLGSRDSELYGCIIYDNGWDAPDRGHGHAVYTQNLEGIKTIEDCFMTGGYGSSIHAYGSNRTSVDNYSIRHNIVYNAGRFLIGGGSPSKGISVLTNFLYNVDMQLGYSAPHNEDCEVKGNLIVNGKLQINRFRKVDESDNLLLSAEGERPSDEHVILRPSIYDPTRANLVIYNWKKAPQVKVDVSSFLKPAERYRLMIPTNFYGTPYLSGTNNDGKITIPVKAEFAAFILMREVPNPESK